MRVKLYKISVLVIICFVLHKLPISCKEKNKSLDFIRGTQIEMSEDLPEDQTVTELIKPYKSDLDAKINEVLCVNPRVLDKRESELESSLGNLLADVCFEAGDSILRSVKGTGIDFAVFNYGGMRAPIQMGDVTIEDIYQLMPFENRLVIVELNPEQVKALIDYIIDQHQAHPISGIRITLDKGKAPEVWIGTEKWNPLKSYHVLTIDYLQHGGGNMTFLTEPDYLFVSDLKVRDALIRDFRRRDTLYTALDGRFTDNKTGNNR